MTTFFTSDLHLGHARICELADRPFSDLDHMNTTLIDNWNERVTPEDTVYVLGDVVMGQREMTLPLLDRLMGRKILVMGNHDYCWPSLWKPSQAAKATRWMDAYGPYFQNMYRYGTEIWLDDGADGFLVKLNHFPYSGDSHGEDRYSEHRPDDDGETWLLHGHTHQKERRSGPRQVHVGVDAWGFAPVTEDEIVAVMAS